MPQYERIRERTKRCKRCGLYRDFSEFYVSSYTKSGCSGWCIDCNRCSKYGISGPEFRALIEKQGGKCAVCLHPLDLVQKGRKQNRPHVDHDPSTNVIRGILCHYCNAGIGLLRHSTTIIRNAYLYLEYYHYERQNPYDSRTSHFTN